MQKLLLILLLMFAQLAFAQRGFLYVKKKGFKKVRGFPEGSVINFETKNSFVVYGGLIQVKKDSILVNSNWYAVADIKKIILRDKKSGFDHETFLWTTGGVIISTAGMRLAKWTDLGSALAYSAGIGYGNFLIQHFPKFRRKKYNIRKKFSLQTLDLHF